MADKLYTVYDADERAVASNQPSPISVESLKSNTKYEGWAVAEQSNLDTKVDVPAFTTKPQPVTGVTLDKETATLEVGATGTAKATVAPADASNVKVAWASSKPEIATVDTTGKYTAVSAGEAVITVTTEDGAKTDSVTLTVTAPA